MELYPLKSKLIQTGDSIADRFEEALSKTKIQVRNGDILAVASKAVSLAEGRTKLLSRVKPTRLARRLGKRYSMPPTFVQVVIEEAGRIYRGVTGTLLTVKNGDAVANSGVDRKNGPDDSVVLWPRNPRLSANNLRNTVTKRCRKRVGVVIVDSRVTPLRLGTIGLAIASSGFEPVRDIRGTPDLYGRKSRITFQALADGIAGAAQLLMGETRERTPFVLVRGAPISLKRTGDDGSIRISAKDCLFMSQIGPARIVRPPQS